MKRRTTPILLVGSTVSFPDIEYASSFRAVDPIVFLETASERCLVVPALEYGRAVKADPAAQVFTPDSLGLNASQRRRLSQWVGALLRRREVKRVIVPAFFPYGVGKRLEAAGVRVEVAKGDLYPQRAVKTAEEVNRIAGVQQAAVIAMRAAVETIARTDIDSGGFLRRRGRRLTSADVRRTIAVVLLEHDCLSKDTIVCGGVKSADPHEVGDGPLRAHQPIVIDIFPQHMRHGYWADLTRTVVRGSASPWLRRVFHAVRAAQHAALNSIKAGVKCATVHRRAVREFSRRGFETALQNGQPCGFIHSTGHGVGLAIHEAPSVGPGDARLRCGNVVTVEPGLYYPEVGGVRIEDTVVVTRDGWRYLVPCEKVFEV